MATTARTRSMRSGYCIAVPAGARADHEGGQGDRVRRESRHRRGGSDGRRLPPDPRGRGSRARQRQETGHAPGRRLLRRDVPDRRRSPIGDREDDHPGPHPGPDIVGVPPPARQGALDRQEDAPGDVPPDAEPGALSHPLTTRPPGYHGRVPDPEEVSVGELVRLEVEDGVGTIRLDRPPMNAIDEDLTRDLFEVAGEAGRRDDVGAVVLYGGEKVFAAGADV